MSSVQTDNPSVISHPLSAEALAEVERENEENELRKAFPVKQSDDADAVAAASSSSQQETTTSTTVEVLKEEQMSDQSSTTDTIQNTTRRAAPTLVKSSWLPVRPFSFFTTEEDDVITLVGQNTIAHALWTRLHQQHKEDTDLLAFLQARKAILLLPQTVMENTSNVTCIERVDLLDHILVRQLPISTSEMKSDDLKDTPDDHQYWLTSLSGHTVVIDKQQHAIWPVSTTPQSTTMSSMEESEGDNKESSTNNETILSNDKVDIINEHVDIILHKHSIIGVLIAKPLTLSKQSNTTGILDVITDNTTRQLESHSLPSPAFNRPSEWNDIVKYLDSFVLEFGRTCGQVDPLKSADTCSEEYQQFIEQVQGMIESTDHLVKDLDIEQALEWMEGYLTIELYPCIFSPTDDARDDLLLESRCMSLRLLHVGLEHLGVSVSEESQPILSSMVEEVRRVLTMMDRRHPPLDKLEAVIELHEIIVKELSNGRLNLNLLSTTESDTKKSKDSPDHSVSPSSSSSISRKSTSTSNTSNASNADQLFPLLVYLIIQTVPAHLISNIRYIQRYRHRDALKSKYAYCLTNMFAVISFLETIDMKALGLIPATESLPSSTDTGTITTSDSVHLEKERAASVFSVPTLPIPESSQPMIAAAFKGGRDATVAVAGGVNKAITGAVDIGFSVFGRLLNARGTAAIPASVVGNAPPSITGTMSDAASIRSETSQRLSSIDTKKEKEAPRSMASVSSTVNTNVVVTTQQDSSVESTMTAIAATTSLSPEVKSSVELDVCHVLPPIRRFVDCAIEDLKVNDVAELLEDYKRLASVVDVYRLELAKRKQ